MTEAALVTVPKSRHQYVWFMVVMVACAAVVAVMFFFNPVEHVFFPRCYFKMVTGWDCPGCGGLRATHQLLHGHVREAFALNPLFILALPFLAYLAIGSLTERFTGKKLPRLFKSSAWVWMAAVIVVAFGILRNLPWHHWLGR